MPGPFQGVLYLQDSAGGTHEVINQARTAAYLADPALALEVVPICDLLDFGGCELYAYELECGASSGGHIDFPGTAGNDATTPDVAALDVLGDITIVARIAPDDWTPAAIQTIVAKWVTTGNQRSYMLDLLTTGALRFSWSNDGTANNTATSTANLSALAANEWKYVGVTFDVNNGAAGRTARFVVSDDGQTWAPLGTDVTTATATSIANTTAPLTVASSASGSNRFAGLIEQVSVRNGIGPGGAVGGTEVFRYDGPVDLVGVAPGAASVVVSSGQTLTLNHSGSPDTTVVPYDSGVEWVPIGFDTPAADGAPWYSTRFPQSADALGFYIESWTGLDAGHVGRPSSAIGASGGGARFGPLSSEGRIMKLNINIFGRSDKATTYLFDWLSGVLAGVCSTCETRSMLIRRYCGAPDDPWDGVVQMREVALVEGLTWESEMGITGACYVRRASFTLSAGDPCMYLPETDRPANLADSDADVDACLDTIDLNEDRVNCRPFCMELNSTCRTVRTIEVDPLGVQAPVITWTNPSTGYTYPFRAIIYYDPHESGALPNPCGLQIVAELYVRALPPGAEMRWDITGRLVEYRDHTTGTWQSGWAYTMANDPPTRKFAPLPCGTSQLVMEPASMCAAEVDADTFTLEGITYDPPRFPTVSIKLSERVNCP